MSWFDGKDESGKLKYAENEYSGNTTFKDAYGRVVGTSRRSIPFDAEEMVKYGEERWDNPRSWESHTDYRDADGNPVGSSSRGFSGDIVYRDRNGREIGSARPYPGGVDYFDEHGNKVGRSLRTFFHDVKYGEGGNPVLEKLFNGIREEEAAKRRAEAEREARELAEAEAREEAREAEKRERVFRYLNDERLFDFSVACDLRPDDERFDELTDERLLDLADQYGTGFVSDQILRLAEECGVDYAVDYAHAYALSATYNEFGEIDEFGEYDACGNRIDGEDDRDETEAFDWDETDASDGSGEDDTSDL